MRHQSIFRHDSEQVVELTPSLIKQFSLEVQELKKRIDAITVNTDAEKLRLQTEYVEIQRQIDDITHQINGPRGMRWTSIQTAKSLLIQNINKQNNIISGYLAMVPLTATNCQINIDTIATVKFQLWQAIQLFEIISVYLNTLLAPIRDGLREEQKIEALEFFFKRITAATRVLENHVVILRALMAKNGITCSSSDPKIDLDLQKVSLQYFMTAGLKLGYTIQTYRRIFSSNNTIRLAQLDFLAQVVKCYPANEEILIGALLKVRNEITWSVGGPNVPFFKGSALKHLLDQRIASIKRDPDRHYRGDQYYLNAFNKIQTCGAQKSMIKSV